VPLLRLDAVSKSFGALKVIDGLSLELADGEALGIIGPNGAGKTTLFNLITGDLAPSSGTRAAAAASAAPIRSRTPSAA
jgi:branched-chain amino acid transport system ATP-binding protein